MFLRICLILLLGFIACKDFSFLPNKKESPKAIKGILDLRSPNKWNLDADGSIELNGEWNFDWKEFSPPSNSITQNYITVPNNWNNLDFKDKPKGSSVGYATYRLQVLLPEKKTEQPERSSSISINQNPLALKLLFLSSAYKVYINGNLLVEVGKIGKTKEESQPEFLPQILLLPPVDQLEIIIQISNFHHSKGGIVDKILLGKSKELFLEREKKLAVDLLLFGGLFLMGLYHLGLFALRKNDRSTLYFGSLCILVSLRSLLNNEGYWFNLFINFPWFLTLKLEYLTMSAGMLFLLQYIGSLFKNEMPYKLKKFLLVLAVSFSFIVISTPIFIFTKLLYTIQITAFFIFSVCIYTMVVSAFRSQNGARSFLVGFLLFFIVMINDTLHANSIIHTGIYGPLGFLIFIFLQSFFLSTRFSTALTTSEKLSEDLKDSLKVVVEKEEQYRTLIGNLNVGIYRNTGKIEGEFLQANPMVAKMFGYDTVEEFMKVPVSELYVDIEERKKFISIMQEKGVCKNLELLLKRKDGSHFWASLNAKAKFNENGNIKWVDGAIEDITDLRTVTDELIQLSETLENKVSERTRDLEKAKAEIEALNHFTGLINSLSNLDEIFIEISKYIYERYGIMGSWLFLPDKNNEFLHAYKAYSYCRLPEHQYQYLMNKKISLSKEGGFLYLTFKRKKPFYLPKISKFEFSIDKEFVEVLNIRSFLCIPLLSKNKVTGIYTFSNLEKVMKLSKAEIRSIANLCYQISGVIETVHLLRQVQEEKEKSEEAKKQAEIDRGIAQIAQEEAEKEREKSEKLLLNILPENVAKELKEKGIAEPILFDNVSVMFTDFKGFTQIAEKLTPKELIKELDACFSQFDQIAEKYNLEKLKTIGDSYMCAGGVPVKNSTHAIDCVLAALEIQKFMDIMKNIKESIDTSYWELRLGIHSGPLVAGVIGKKKFAYDVWGDTVNTASRMESSGTAGKINVSETTYQLIQDFFDCEYRGQVNAKNKGLVNMYYVNGLKKEYSKDESGKDPNRKFWKEYEKLRMVL